jgi:hypothetical protein
MVAELLRPASDTSEWKYSRASETDKSEPGSSIPDDADSSVQYRQRGAEFLVTLGRLGDGLARRQCVLQIELDLVATH